MPQTAETLAARIAYAEKLPNSAPRIVSASCALNGYTDSRAAHMYAHAVTYRTPTGHRGIALWRDDIDAPAGNAYRYATHAVYLIDDGRTVTPYYVAGYAPTDEPNVMFLHPFPVSDRPMPGWNHPPTRAYHVTLSRVPAIDDWHRERYGDTSGDLFSV